MLIVQILMLGLIIICLALAGSSVYKLIIYYGIKKNGSFAEGVIVGFKEKGDILMSMGNYSGKEIKKFYPVVEYYTENGSNVRAEYMGFVINNSGNYSEGQKVQIKYDPAKNDRFILIGDNNLHGNAWGTLVVGIGFGILSVIMFRMTI